jgi:hypothetical protein
MSNTATIHLQKHFFTEKEKTLAEYGGLTASAFRWDSGVEGLRLKNSRGELVLLPYQGQQIWSAAFEGRPLQMVSMFDQPRPTNEYLDTYGGFFLHCGATAMGVGGPEDNHPLHGELPNAPYQKAYLQFGADQGGDYIALGGSYQHTVAFNHNYLFEPLVKLYADLTLFSIGARLTNLKKSPMDWMYMGHLNFRPLDGGRIHYSAPCTPEATRVFVKVPEHIQGAGGREQYVAFLEALAKDPSLHTEFKDGQVFDPEAVFSIDYLADEAGWAHSMHQHPDGYAHYIAHRPEQLGHGIRWISRTPDQQALGLCLPATAEHQGYTAEKAKGNVDQIEAGAAVEIEIQAGLLEPGAAQGRIEDIKAILA